MPYPVGTPYSGATPSPAYAGTFIPTIWSTKLLEKFYSATVLAAMANTDYEGEVSKFGDTVNIRQIPTLLIRNYSADQVLTVDRPSSNILQLLIDKGSYFAAVLDDVMRIQSDLQMLDMWSRDASEQLKIVIDQAVLAAIPAGIDAKNKGDVAGNIAGNMNLGKATAPLVVVASGATGVQGNIMDVIIKLGQCLDEYNIPETGRWLVIPAWVASLLKSSDLRNASIMGDTQSVYRNGRLGMLDRFTVYTSNLLPTAVESAKTAHWMFAGHSHGLTFASQLTEMETMRVESSFGTLIRGLQVYGYKVIDGKAIAGAYVVQ